jgi:hypothetical protein
MGKPNPQIARAAIFEIIENQMRSTYSKKISPTMKNGTLPH